MGWFDRNNPKPAEPEPVAEEVEEEEEEEQDPPEYRVITADNPKELEQKINEIAAEGYEVWEFKTNFVSGLNAYMEYTVIMKQE